MKIKSTGCIKDGQIPPKKIPKQHAYLEDMWGCWYLYEDVYHELFPNIIKEFVKSRNSSCNYFNENYIRKVIVNN